MSFKYEDEMLELDFKGTKHPFREPSAVEYKMVMEKFKEAQEKPDQIDALDIYVEFFVELGIPKDGVLDKMSMKGLSGLFSYAIGSKKN